MIIKLITLSVLGNGNGNGNGNDIDYRVIIEYSQSTINTFSFLLYNCGFH